ncbi:hypothetical protein [Nocardioides jejuensis]|uniref:Uncharacterized protein n=1 Tax=Nocardioides jejuensis TaxID=2502782 RepID=A0A4R1BY69_9ACTN|nr:hypothetical protein [Nocardioides jejuensis]TCJ23019.1 hypothetical protein EPD65_11700 [Nocardioides jejuensis]
MAKRFRIKDKVYTFATASDVTLRDLLLVEKETEELGHKIHMGEITRIADEFQALKPGEAKYHPEAGWMLAVTVWMAMVRDRRERGDLSQVPFAAAIDFTLSDFHEVPDVSDHKTKGGSKPGPTKPARAASAQAESKPEGEQPKG